MKKLCLRLLISGAVLAVTGFVVLSVAYINGFIDELPSLSIPIHSYATNYTDYGEYAGEYAETSFVTTYVIDESAYYDYGYDSTIYIDTGYQEIYSLNIDISMGRFDIIPGDTFMIMTRNIEPDDLQYSTANSCLSISFKPEFKLFDFNFMDDSAAILITVPEKIYENIYIGIGAGTANILGLTANNFVFDMSAGEAYVTNVTAYNSSDIEMSAGYSAFADCTFKGSGSIKVSAGDMDFSGCSITGKSEIKVSAGVLTMDLKGDHSYYNIFAKRSAGTLEIPGMDKNKSEYNVAATKFVTSDGIPGSNDPNATALGTIDVKVSAGSCHIYFEED